MVSIVGIGGTLRESSSSASALRFALEYAESRGAETSIFTGDTLRLPLYEPTGAPLSEAAELVARLRGADGILIASPGYHGSISGTLKNVLDYTEELASDPKCYFDGRAVGCIVTAAGWQAGGSTLATLRAIVHALRGWPTPLGVLINSNHPAFDVAGACLQAELETNLKMMTDQVLDFARMRLRDAVAA